MFEVDDAARGALRMTMRRKGFASYTSVLDEEEDLLAPFFSKMEVVTEKVLCSTMRATPPPKKAMFSLKTEFATTKALSSMAATTPPPPG